MGHPGKGSAVRLDRTLLLCASLMVLAFWAPFHFHLRTPRRVVTSQTSGGSMSSPGKTVDTLLPPSPPSPPHRCSLKDYTVGSWRRSDQPPQRPGYKFCHIDIRQDCRAYASRNPGHLLQTWVPDDPRCALRYLGPAKVKRCLARQKLVFWGDSLGRNQLHSLQCMLLERPEAASVMKEDYRDSQHTYWPETQTSVRWEHTLFARPHEIAGKTSSLVSWKAGLECHVEFVVRVQPWGLTRLG